MKNKFFVYTNNIKSLPKVLIIFIIILLLVLIPIILSIAVVSLIGMLAYFTIKSLLPGKKREKNLGYQPENRETIYLDENGNVIK